MNSNINIKDIIEFIKTNLSEKPTLRNTINKIISGEWENKAYYKFVDSTNAKGTVQNGYLKRTLFQNIQN